jgi:hypothetical protein
LRHVLRFSLYSSALPFSGNGHYATVWFGRAPQPAAGAGAIAPDGRTAYVTSGATPAGGIGASVSQVGVVTPIDTRTQVAERATTVAGEPVAIVIAP